MDQRDQDALAVEEVGPNWMRVLWTVSTKTLERAASAMGRDAHRATRVLRLLKVEQDDSGPRSQELSQQIELPGAANVWFLHIPATEHAWIVEIGMRFAQGRFFSMLHSVPTVLNGSQVSLHGTQRFLGGERFFDPLNSADPPPLKVQGKFVMNGTTRPGALVTIDDQSVSVDHQTGDFEWELPLSNGRIVVPMDVFDSGKTQRALLAIDLNFHLLEPEPAPE